MNFYKYNDKNIAFELQGILLEDEAKFEDILNYISMCKGDSKWKEVQHTIDKYIDNNNFKDLQKAQFYYIIGRMYVDDLNNFSLSKEYLEKSIKIYDMDNELENNSKFLNKEIELYYLNSKAIFLIQNNEKEELNNEYD